MLKNFILSVLLVGFFVNSSAHAQESDSTSLSAWSNFRLPLVGTVSVSPTFFQPTSRIYFDTGIDEDEEVDLFVDGKLSIGIDMVGFDFYESVFGGRGKVGIDIGGGIATSNSGTTTYGVLLLGAGVFLELNSLFRYEAGVMKGFSAQESDGDKDDTGFYLGIAFPTELGERLADEVGRRR